jgi:hypothetical protein
MVAAHCSVELHLWGINQPSRLFHTANERSMSESMQHSGQQFKTRPKAATTAAPAEQASVMAAAVTYDNLQQNR